MGKKYIIELEREETAYKTVNSNGTPLIQLLAPTPYTEPDLEQVKKEAYEDGYKTAKVQCNIQAEKDLREVGERHYQKGLSDAWEAAKKLWEIDISTLHKIFYKETRMDCYMYYTATEVIEKLKAREQAQKEEKSISAEEVMRQYLDTFCKSSRCVECILHTSDFTCGRGYHFLSDSPVSDEEVRRAYAKVVKER